jgi:Abnormal spindle-like microcephaly-assoc'd, ASPM-SPD-2-Hydin
VTLAGGQSVTGHLTFTPQSSGTASAVLSITFSNQNSNGKHNSSGGSNTVTLPVSGVGSAASGQLTTTPASLAFGNVQVGNSQTLAETLTNSGAANVTISGASAIGSGFNASGLSLPITLSVGQSVAVSIKFAPTSGSSVSGNLAITSNASNFALNVPLSGTGVTPGQLTANPANLGFGSVATGSSSTLAETLTNSGGSALTISQITPSGTGFNFSGISLPLTLSAAQSVTFKASFAPQSAGSAAGSFLISSNGSNPAVSVPSSGTGTLPGQLAVAPSTINFGTVTVGSTQSQTSTLSASSSPVIVTSLGVSGSQFSVSGIALPVTIAAGNSVSFQLTFAPKAAGAVSANVTFASNASNSPAVQSLTGSGALLQHSVSLGWNTSTSSNVAGYNIYRETSPGGPVTRINSALDTTPFDTDSTVQSGQTYYYVVTALDSAGTESSYSNQVQAVIPYP